MDAGRDRQESGCCKPATPSMTTVTRAWKRVSPGHSLPQKPKRKTSTLRPSPQSLASASKGAQVSREAQLKLLQGATEHTQPSLETGTRGDTTPESPRRHLLPYGALSFQPGSTIFAHSSSLISTKRLF